MVESAQSRAGAHFGHYQLRRLLGRGGMGEVYEAYDEVKDRVVALKLLPDDSAADPVFRERFQRESHAAARLQEPHVIPIHDYGEIDGTLFIDMRLVKGADLGALIEQHGPLPPGRAVTIISQIASAVDAAHDDGLIHRDIKPPNILVTRDDFAYLVDFGITKDAGAEKITAVGMTIGTLAYMAPERFLEGTVTTSVDIYSLTCVLHESLTGSQPYPHSSDGAVMNKHLNGPIPRPSAIRPGVSTSFDAVIARGMAKAPEGRYPSAGELAVAARAALTAADRAQPHAGSRRDSPPSTLFTNQRPSPAPGVPQPNPAIAQPTQREINPNPPGSSGPPPPPLFGPPMQGPPPSHPNRPARRRSAWWAAAAAALAAPLVVAGLWWLIGSGDESGTGGTTATGAAPSTCISFRGGGCVSSPPTRPPTTRPTSKPSTSLVPMPGPASSEAVLFDRLPQGYSDSSCSPVEYFPPALTGMTCGPTQGGPTTTRMFLYKNVPDVESSLQDVVTGSSLVPCPGVGQGPINWYQPNDPTHTVVGQYACAQTDGHPRLIWTNTHELTMGIADGTDLGNLNTWWSQNR